MADLATQAAAHAAILDMRHRVSRNGSGLGRIVSEGQPESRIQLWSPVQVSGSTPKRSRTTRRPSRTAFAASGFSRRWRFNMHSDCATMIFGPLSDEVSASRSVSRNAGTS